MSNQSLAYRLGLYISLAVLLVFMIFIFIILKFHYSVAKKSNENKAVLQSSEVIWRVRDVVEKTDDISSSVSRQIAFYQKSRETEAFLSGILRQYEFLQSIEVHLTRLSSIPEDSVFAVSRGKNGILFYRGNTPGDICINVDTLKHYFPDPGEKGWSEPFWNNSRDQVFSVYSFPFENSDIINQKVTSGIIRCIISVDYLSELINNNKIWKNGYAFLASPKGTFMTYPLRDYVLKRNISSVYYNEKRTKSSELAKFMKGKYASLIIHPPALNYVKAWSFSIVLYQDHCDWLLIFTIPFSELQQNILSLMLKMIAVLLILEIAIFTMVFYIAQKVMKPLTKISNALHRFSIEFLDQKPGTRNETVALQKSLARLQERYEKYKRNEEEITSKSKKLLSDLALASEIQQSIIPRTGNYTLQNSGITIHTVFRPAHLISGDLYDFFMIDEKRLLITVGDVSGGGIPAALFMGVAHTYIRSNPSYNSAKDVVLQANTQLCKNNSNQFFLTLFLGILDIRSGVLNYCNAGHSQAVLISGNGKIREFNDQHGLPLGLYPDKEYTDTFVTISKGDTLILYTDGVTEHVNEKGEFFGTEQLRSLFTRTKRISPEESAMLIMQKVDQFGKGIPQQNDLCLMVVNYD